jgi:hypothetical protein
MAQCPRAAEAAAGAAASCMPGCSPQRSGALSQVHKTCRVLPSSSLELHSGRAQCRAYVYGHGHAAVHVHVCGVLWPCHRCKMQQLAGAADVVQLFCQGAKLPTLPQPHCLADVCVHQRQPSSVPAFCQCWRYNRALKYSQVWPPAMPTWYVEHHRRPGRAYDVYAEQGTQVVDKEEVPVPAPVVEVPALQTARGQQ